MTTLKRFLAETSLAPIEKFLASGHPNTWLKYGTMEVYVRRGYHYVDGRAAHTFDVANVNQAEEQKGKGQFRLLIKELKELLEARPELRQEVEGIYVENVGNKQLAASLPSMGFKLVPDREPLNTPSFYLPLAPRPIKEAENLYDLYKLHADPKSLRGYEETDKNAPNIFWDRYKDKPEELKKREPGLAKSIEYSIWYARDILKGPFKLGEPAIAKDAGYSYLYAQDILKGPFKLGEPAIAKSANYSYMYARYILKGPFKLGEPAIAKDARCNRMYTRFVLKA